MHIPVPVFFPTALPLRLRSSLSVYHPLPPQTNKKSPSPSHIFFKINKFPTIGTHVMPFVQHTLWPHFHTCGPYWTPFPPWPHVMGALCCTHTLTRIHTQPACWIAHHHPPSPHLSLSSIKLACCGPGPRRLV